LILLELHGIVQCYLGVKMQGFLKKDLKKRALLLGDY